MPIFRLYLPSPLLVASALGLLGLTLSAQEDMGMGQRLDERSPFLPPGGAVLEEVESAPVSGPLQDRFELRGFYQINGVFHLLIKDRQQPAGRWMRSGETTSGISVGLFDPSAKTVSISADGQQGILPLAKIEASPAPMQVSGMPDGTSRGGRGGQASSGPPSLARRPGIIGSGSGGNTDGSDTRTPTRRPPPPPAWIRERMRQQGIEIPELTEEPQEADQPPNFQPPPPPNYEPPDLPDDAAPPDPGGDGGDNNNGSPQTPAPGNGDSTEPGFHTPGAPPSYRPPQGTPGSPPSAPPPGYPPGY